MAFIPRRGLAAVTEGIDLLRLEGVTKRFGGIVALSQVDFDLRPGEIHAICGENGAGKSTLIKILSGVYPAGSYEGRYLIDAQPVRISSHQDAKATGIAVIYQELALCDELTVAENIFLGNEPRKGPLGLFLDHARMAREAAALLATFGIHLDPQAQVRKLGTGQKQLVEIAKALGRCSRILVLDEPTAALSARETQVLLELLKKLRAQGTACIYISHKLEEVFAIADRITVLRDGQSVYTRPAAKLDLQAVIAGMCGRPVRALFPTPLLPKRIGPEPVLAVRELTAGEHATGPARLRGISLAVFPGEVVGIGGMLGAGRTELLLHLYGAYGRRLSGSVQLLGKDFAPQNPAAALSAGVALLSEDRRRYGLCMDESVGFNLSLSSLPEVTRHGLIDGIAETQRNLQMAARVRLRGAAFSETLRLWARALSGGNQQKVVLGKALLSRPRLLLLDEPTRGIDLGAKQEIYELIARLCQDGLAVLLVSSELPELLGLCDRIVMLQDGAMTEEFARQQASAEGLLAAALGQRLAREARG